MNRPTEVVQAVCFNQSKLGVVVVEGAKHTVVVVPARKVRLGFSNVQDVVGNGLWLSWLYP